MEETRPYRASPDAPYRTSEKRRQQALRQYYANRDKAMARAKEWKARNVDRVRLRNQKYGRKYILAKYGLTQDQYERMAAERDGKCDICRRRPPDTKQLRNLRVDHDHETGAVRGLLCNSCNAGMGQLGDDPDRLMAAVRYLLRAGGKRNGSRRSPGGRLQPGWWDSR
jgi:hypothetical protein